MSSTMLLPCITTVIVLLAALAFLGRGKRRNCRLPPGSMGWPLIGETAYFSKPHPTTTIGPFMGDRISRFGKIFMTSLFGNLTVVSADAELNRFMLQNDLKLFEPGWPGSMAKLLGETTVSLQVGDAHKYKRSLIVNFLSSARLRSVFLRDAEQLGTMLLRSWKESSVIFVKDEARKFTFDIMAKNVMGIDPGPDSEELAREFETLVKGFISLPLNLPGTAYYKALQSRKKILQVVKQNMEERIQEKSDGSSEVREDDFLGWVMVNTDYSPQEIGELMLSVLFAGHETTAKAIPLMLYFLQGCPKAVEQLRAEHVQIAQSKEQEDRKLAWHDYKKMDFTQCVINETLRLGNIVKYLQRKASTDVHFNGYDIPRGCTVSASLTAVHLDPTLFEEPKVFNPWRVQASSGVKKSNNFMPFGGGARLCPGSELARLEMAVFLHHLILSYNWELIEPHQPLAVPYVYFPDGLPMKISTLPDDFHKIKIVSSPPTTTTKQDD